jgi:hypothetical protein
MSLRTPCRRLAEIRRRSDRFGSGRRRKAAATQLAGAGAEWPGAGECTRAHAKARAERRRNGAEEIAAAGAAAVVGDRANGIRTEPVPAEIAHRIDALHRETGQILHAHPSVASQLCLRGGSAAEFPWAARTRLQWRRLCCRTTVVSRENATRNCGGVAESE